MRMRISGGRESSWAVVGLLETTRESSRVGERWKGIEGSINEGEERDIDAWMTEVVGVETCSYMSKKG